MAVTETIEFDLDLIDRLIADEEATLEPKHRASIEYRTVAERHVAGGVASSWQDSPPHAIFIDRGEGSHIWDLDGNEYVDYHLGYGAMVIGHAHPKVVEAIEKRARLGTHFAQPTAQLHEIGENVAERFGLPLWRFCNSGTEATLEAVRLMRANTGRDLIVKIEGTLPRPPRFADVLRGSGSGADRPPGASGHGPAGDGDPAGVRGPRPGGAVQRPRRGGAGVRRERGAGRRDDRRAGDDELRRRPAAAGLPPGSARPLPSPRGVPRLRRGQDRRDDRVGRCRRGLRRAARHRRRWRRRSAAAFRAGRSAPPRSSSAPSSAAITTSRARSTGTR